MSGYAFWDRLWEMHDETKSLISFNPEIMIKHFSKDHLSLATQHQEKEVDLAEDIEDVPAEHIERIQTILGIIITVAITYLIVLPMFGIQIGVVPDWAMVVK